MDLSTSVFVYVGSIVLYKRIVNAYTQSIRIADADGQGRIKINRTPIINLIVIYRTSLKHFQASLAALTSSKGCSISYTTVRKTEHCVRKRTLSKIVIYLIINEVTFWHGF